MMNIPELYVAIVLSYEVSIFIFVLHYLQTEACTRRSFPHNSTSSGIFLLQSLSSLDANNPRLPSLGDK